MNPLLGWTLAVLLLAAAWRSYGWPGVAFAITAVVFWLLLQFNRSIRVMKNASGVPVGFIDNAVMLNARLKRGMPMIQVVTLTKSLGHKLSDMPERWSWTDGGGSTVRLEFANGRLQTWTLERPAETFPTP
jgi:hypothetical protein